MGDFATEFHSLSGNTVGEKRRSLLQLFHTHPNPTLTDIDPENHLERLFYVDSLIYYRNFEKLYAKYLQNDDITVNKLRNVPWFFRNVLDMPEDFVREVLPKFGYTARHKLITGTAKVMTETEADEIFDALVDRYGLAHGLRIVTKCSTAKLLKIVDEHDDCVKLKDGQVNALYKTCPEIFEKLISDKNSKIFLEIANRDPDFFVKLVTNGKCRMRLGRRSTKKLLETKKETVLDKVAFYLANVLNQKKFVRIMAENIEQIYGDLLSSTPTLVRYGDDWDFLQHCPKNKQYLIHMRAVEKKFGNFAAEFVTESFLDLVKDDKLREKLAKAKYKETQNEDWWKYYNTKECLVKVTEMLNSSSNLNKRVSLARILAVNCCNNQDYKGLLLVLEMVANRLKNDNACLIHFMSYLDKGIDFKKFTPSHWRLLIEIVSAPGYENASLANYIKTHVNYMAYLNEVDLREELDAILKAFLDKFGRDKMMDYIKFDASKYPGGGKFEQEFLIGETYRANWNMLKRVVDYNKRNGAIDPIDVFEIRNLEELLQERVISSCEVYVAKEIFNSLFSNHEFRTKTQELYWSHLGALGSVKSITWYLTRDLDTFTCHFDSFLDACFNRNRCLNNKSLWRKIKCHPALVEKLLQYLQQQNSPKIFNILAHFVTLKDYVKAFENLKMHIYASVNSYDRKFNKTEEEKQILMAFRQFVTNAKTLRAKPQSLLSFTGSRPFVERVPMVYHAFYNIPENEALPFLEKIRVGGVSTTKQALFLTCVICERKTVAEELKRNKLTQSVPQVLRYFIKNPSDDLFDVVLLRLKKLDQNNSDTTTLATNVSRIPKKYQPKYFEALWKVLTDTRSKSLKQRVISCCDSSELHLEQVVLVFESDFLRRNLWNFTVKFLIANPAKLEVKLDLFFKHLAQYKRDYWNESFAKTNVSGFVGDFADSYLASCYPAADDADVLMVKFVDMFKASFRDAEVLQELTKMALVQLKNKTVEDGAKLFSNLIDDVVDRFSEVCLKLVVDCAQEVFERSWFGFTHLSLCYNLLKFKKSAYNAIVVLNLLPKTKPKDSEEIELVMYYWVMSTIQSMREASVEVYLNLYYKS